MRTWSNDRSHHCRTVRIRPALADFARGSGTQHPAPRCRTGRPVSTWCAAPSIGLVRSRGEPGRSLPAPAGTIELRAFVSVEVDRRTARVGVEEWVRSRGGGLAGRDYSHPLPGKTVFADVSLILGNRELRSETTSACNVRASAGSVCPRYGPAPGLAVAPMLVVRCTIPNNGWFGLTLSRGDTAGRAPARGVAIVLDVSGSFASAGMDRARQAVRLLFRTPGTADQFRSNPADSAAGRRSGRRRRTPSDARCVSAPGTRGRSAGGTHTGRGVRNARTGRGSGRARAPAIALGNVLVLLTWTARDIGESQQPAGHEHSAPVAGCTARDTARRGCAPGGYTMHLVQEPLPGGSMPRGGRTVYP